MTTLRRCCLFSVLVLIGLSMFFSVHKVHKKYRKKIRDCRSQSVANQPCNVFPNNPRRKVYKGIFQSWATLADRHNISYVLAAGTLLGQYRNEDMIPWDGDVDVYVDGKYYDHLKRLAHPRNFTVASDDVYRLLVQPELHVRRDGERPTFPRVWNCDGREVKPTEYADTCGFGGVMARMIQRNDYVDVFTIETQNGYVFDDEENVSYKYSDMYPIVDCKFMGIRTKCPNNTTAVLARYFSSLKPPCKCVEGKWTPDWNLRENLIY